MRCAARVTCSSVNGAGCLGQAAVAVVLAVDAQGAEVRRQTLDLAQEVGRREPALAELARQRVGGGGEGDARVDELAEQGRYEDGVAGIVQLELVDAQQTVARKGLDRLLEAEGADEVRQLHEGAERLERGLGRGGVPEGGEQVGLADAVAAVEVDATGAGRGLRRLALPEAQEAAPDLAGCRRRAPRRARPRSPRGRARPRSGWAGSGPGCTSRSAPSRTAAAAPSRRPAGPRGHAAHGRTGTAGRCRLWGRIRTRRGR